MLKKISFIIMIATMQVLAVHAQTVVKYSYDDAGNRKYRGVITLPPQQQSESKKAIEKPKPLKEELGEQKIIIYPNPTMGELIVEIEGYDPGTRTEASIFSLKGKKFQTQTFASSRVNLDLTGYPTGTYILKIKTGTTQGEWKIVKE